MSTPPAVTKTLPYTEMYVADSTERQMASNPTVGSAFFLNYKPGPTDWGQKCPWFLKKVRFDFSANRIKTFQITHKVFINTVCSFIVETFTLV